MSNNIYKFYAKEVIKQLKEAAVRAEDRSKSLSEQQWKKDKVLFIHANII